MSKFDVNPKLQKAYDFFLKHAGYEKGRRQQAALELARAEALAEALGWTLEWEEDPEEYQTDLEDDNPKEVLIAVLLDESGKVVQSLGGIGDPDKSFARLTEAELCLQELYDRGLL